MSDTPFDGIQLRLNNTPDPIGPEWPQERPRLSCKASKQLSLQNCDLKLDKDRKVLFEGNGQISAVGDLSFLTGAPDPTEQMKIFANGNVGIGIGARIPTNTLEVAGAIQATDLEITGSITANTITGPLTLQNNLTVMGNLTLGDSSVSKFSRDTTFNSNSDLAIPTEKAVKTYVDAKVDQISSSLWAAEDGSGTIYYNGGNVGIGTTIPTEKLVVDGKIKANSLNVTGTVDIGQTINAGANVTVRGTVQATRFVGDGSGLTGLPSGDSFWAGDENHIYFEGDTVTIQKNVTQQLGPVLVLQNDGGNLGAGAAIDFNGYDVEGNSSTARIQSLDDKDFSSHLTFSTKEPGQKENQLQERLRIGSTGDVGIGANTPQAKLHIYEPKDNRGEGGHIKFFDKGAEWKYEFSYDGGSDGVFTFTNTGKSSGETRFQSSATGKNLLTIRNSGCIVADHCQPSSRELKENIIDLSFQEALEVLTGLNPTKFNYRQDEEKKLRAGFIAEDVPDLLAAQDNKTISPLDIVAVLTKVIKQQQEELFSLKERLNMLEARA